jgi:hypothetical protein
VRGAGFVDLELGELVDVFSGSAHESDAREFETRGVAFCACKPNTKEQNDAPAS